MSSNRVVPFDRPPTDPPPDGLLLNPKDPRKNAKAWLVRAKLEGKVWYVDGQFYIYEAPAYRVLSPAELRSKIGEFLDRALKQPNLQAGPSAFQPTREDVNQTVDALQQILWARAESPSWLAPSKLDPRDCALCSNGILHVPTGVLHPLSPSFFSVNALAFPYLPNAPRPTHWLAFLDALWPDEPEPIALLQEWIGYLLTPDTRYQKMLVMVGPPRSGKGTIAKVLLHLLGAANVCAPTLTAMATQFGRQVLIGKTAAIFPDAKISGRMDTAAIVEGLLSISGEDIQTIPRKNLIDWTGLLRARFTLLTNEMPRMDDDSGALVGRMLLLPMTETFLGREDLALLDRLLPELPGILRWAREGWLRLRARGRFSNVTISDDMRQEIRELSSPLHAFLSEWCTTSDNEASIGRQELFSAWRAWCKDQGREHPGTESHFGRKMQAAMPQLKVSRPGTEGERPRIYLGIDLKIGRRQ